ncbi:MAG: hypothetical protein KA715_00565 [Xanthomonadaceae bacterium]|nr:hypothetical protein [Xanthomonadaceae bacterium]
MSNKKRYQFLVYPKFQLVMVGVQLLVLGCSLIPLGMVLMRSFDVLEKSAVTSGLAPGHGFFHFLSVQKTLILSSALWPVVAGIIVNLVVTIWLSDKLVGPIIRLKKEFQKMENSGEVVEVNFRKGDFFSDLPPIVNRALKRLRR